MVNTNINKQNEINMKNLIISATILLTVVALSAWWWHSNQQPALALEENQTLDNSKPVVTILKNKPHIIPDEVNFAGENVPVQYFDVYESLDREILVNSYWHSATLQIIKLSKKLFPVIEPILQKNGVPDDFKYLAAAESGLRNVTSPAGAKGYWQIMSSTAKQYGLEVNSYVDERCHLEKSTEAACKYLNGAYKEFGNWALVAASYNAGRAGISRQLDRQNANSYYDLLLNSETARYMYRLIAFKLIMENPAHFGFDISEGVMYKYPQIKEIKVENTVDNLIDFAKSHSTNYKVLHYLNPWLRTDKLPNISGKTYYLKIPVDGGRKTY